MYIILVKCFAYIVYNKQYIIERFILKNVLLMEIHIEKLYICWF